MRIKAKRNLLYKGDIIPAGEEATVDAKAGQNALKFSLATEVQEPAKKRETAKETATETKTE